MDGDSFRDDFQAADHCWSLHFSICKHNTVFKETSGQFQDAFVLSKKSLQLTNLMFVIKRWDISA